VTLIFRFFVGPSTLEIVNVFRETMSAFFAGNQIFLDLFLEILIDGESESN